MAQKINILLVDDVDFSRDLLRSAVKSCISDDKLPIEPQFYYTSAGKDVLEIIKLKQVHLVYLDIDLPDINGLDILKDIKQQHSDVDVIMVSSESSSTNVMGAIKSGASGFIVKPFNTGRINESLRNYIKKGDLQ